MCGSVQTLINKKHQAWQPGLIRAMQSQLGLVVHFPSGDVAKINTL
jgi:hypothetical protein